MIREFLQDTSKTRNSSRIESRKRRLCTSNSYIHTYVSPICHLFEGSFPLLLSPSLSHTLSPTSASSSLSSSTRPHSSSSNSNHPSSIPRYSFVVSIYCHLVYGCRITNIKQRHRIVISSSCICICTERTHIAQKS